MDLERLLQMLGVTTVAEASTAITRANMLVEGVMTETDAESAAEALQRFKSTRANLRAIEQAVGADGADAIAKVEALKGKAERATELEAQLSGLQKAGEKKRAEELIGQAITEQRLPPAMRAKADALYTEHGLGVLESYLAAFDKPLVTPPSSGSAPKQPKQGDGQMSGQDEFTDEEREIMRILHRSPEQMRAGKKLWNDSAKGGSAFVPEHHIRALNEKKTTKGAA